MNSPVGGNASIFDEIIVTDDAPEPATQVWLNDEFPRVRWVAGPGRGPAANRNHGARLAVGDWLAFTDDDCLPSEGWLPAYSSAIEANPNVSVFEGKTMASGERPDPLAHAPVNQNGGYLWSCNFCIARSKFEALGGFDERFPYAAMEDVDFYHRIKARGLRAQFVPDAIVLHPWAKRSSRAQWIKGLKSQMIYLRIHPDQRELFGLRRYLRWQMGYYRREFAANVRTFGWANTLRAEGTRWRAILLHAWVYAFTPDPDKIG